MLKSKLLAIAFVFASFTPAFADSTCQAPKAPSLPPNGAVITYEQLNAAADQVKIYSQANMVYKQCLDKVITKPENFSREQWRSALQAYNQSVPAEKDVWTRYEQVSSDWISANQSPKN